MIPFLESLQGWGIPAIVVASLGIVFLLLQAIGELIEVFGKTAPTFLKLRKWFEARKQLRKQQELQYQETASTLKDIKDQQALVEQLLLDAAKQTEKNCELIAEFNSHYSPENIAKRDKWMLSINQKMKWIDERAKVYDNSVRDLTELADVVKKQSGALELNNRMTSELYKQTTRTQILDFSHRLVNARKADKAVIFSREEFRKIRKSYEAYEEFLKNYGGTNGEVDDAMAIIRDAEAGKLPNIEFLEEMRD